MQYFNRIIKIHYIICIPFSLKKKKKKVVERFCSHPMSSRGRYGRGPHPLLQAYGNGQDSPRSGVAVYELSAECCSAHLVYVAHAFNWVKGSMSE